MIKISALSDQWFEVIKGGHTLIFTVFPLFKSWKFVVPFMLWSLPFVFRESVCFFCRSVLERSWLLVNSYEWAPEVSAIDELSLIWHLLWLALNDYIEPNYHSKFIVQTQTRFWLSHKTKNILLWIKLPQSKVQELLKANMSFLFH